MNNLFAALYVIVVVLLLFGASIFLHEFGHYWVARRRGLKVEAFAIGFGPKILSWKRNGIEYSWRAIPAGGYVKLPQMVTSQALEGTVDHPENIPPASPFSKILVAAAGPIMNVIFAFAVASIIYFVGLPVLVNPPIIGYVDPKSNEALLGIKENDLVVSVNGRPVKSWNDVNMYSILAQTNVFPVVMEREGARKTYYLTATVDEGSGLKLLNLDPRDRPEFYDIAPGTAAEKGGLKAGDVVLSFNGIPTWGHEQLIKLIRQRGGKETDIELKRGANRLTLKVTPAIDPKTKQGFLGANVGGSLHTVYEVQKPGPTPWQQVVDVWRRTVDTFNALFHSRQTGVGAKDLSGPLGILGILALQVKTDYRLALNFLVLLNINLAILNMLPVPVLDGGHIMMAIIERIRRRPLSARFVEYATSAFAILLISFMLYVTFFDIKRIPRFKSLFKRETTVEQMEKNSLSSTNAVP